MSAPVKDAPTQSIAENTVAANMPEQIEEQIKVDRMESIMETQLAVNNEKNNEKIGKTFEVLIEGYDDYIRCYYGRSYADAPEIDGKIFFI